ncbi:hypothetical protein L1049_024695 [Liquidambar formosana]|uniref:Uncharacterized protein n=1 Tax=Liquidambar formosana TaxID=63359 RepID=A0AAP0RVJ7_LIQFO
MNGGERGRRWKALKQRLGFKAMGCCGASWSFSASNMSIREEAHFQEQDGEQQMLIAVSQIPAGHSINPVYVGQNPAAAGMNLATALAAERNLRTVRVLEGGAVGPTGDRAS